MIMLVRSIKYGSATADFKMGYIAFIMGRAGLRMGKDVNEAAVLRDSVDTQDTVQIRTNCRFPGTCCPHCHRHITPHTGCVMR